MHSEYVCPAIRELRNQQVLYAPTERKIEQIDLAEVLLGEIQPSRTYTYEYLCFRITKFRPESFPDVKMKGGDARHDLRLFVEDLSDSANVPADDAGEPVLTVDELSRRFQVSTKTISRWRQDGLVSRRFLFDGRKRVGFLQSSVERFVELNRDRVMRGKQFSQLSEDEKKRIIHDARVLAEEGGCAADVTKRLATQTGRSVETIRYTLKLFDRDNPGLAIFPDNGGPLAEDAKRKIYRQYRRGEAVEALVKKYCRTRTSIYRVIGEMRARRILELPLDYIPNDEFPNIQREGREDDVLGTAPRNEQAARKTRLPGGLPPYLASLYDVPLLTREQEVHLFQKMNYLKYKASELRKKLDPDRPKTTLMNQIDTLYDRAVTTKNEIISANLRLVVSIGKRHVGASENFFELVSDGNVSLIRAVEKFDFARGNKFSTYASWAIMKNYARTIPDEHRHRDRFRTSHGEMFGAAEDNRTDQYEQESAQLEREEQVERILGRLDEREQQIIISRFGLKRGEEPQTLKQVGAEMGVTKERIRQIEARALDKLRKAARDEKISIPTLD